ncbi:amidohydrolase family protein [Aureitalea marina]|uniref:Amidohydrolase-related domain-containing protein n=1 Tax=Aureitalea marina TaxID=930804 RepID=A0A2S7KSZ8_9FLAO|nr:amidohydrolase family protein [Aureitalea marina]PQB05750.1 hypothetical protein BST85_13255 [Aureitalea marina]
MRLIFTFFIFSLLSGCNSNRESKVTHEKALKYEGPIIDMHIHSAENEEFTIDTLGFCLPITSIIQHFDPKDDYLEIWNNKLHDPECDDPIWSPSSYENFIERLTYQLDKHNITAVTSGPPLAVENMYNRIGDRIIKSCQFRIGRDNITTDSLRILVNKNGFRVLGEISNQYEGIAPSDPRMEPYYAVAEELDIPIAIHLGSGLPGHFYFEPGLTPRLSNPLELEPIIRKFPKLRISIMHYGEPYIDELISMMVNYPQLYADIGGMQVFYPREYFYEYHLKKMVSAGLGKRIMFGTDMIIWPEIIDRAVKVIDEAPFLSMKQKDDIFYNNAARFLRLEEKKK